MSKGGSKATASGGIFSCSFGKRERERERERERSIGVARPVDANIRGFRPNTAAGRVATHRPLLVGRVTDERITVRPNEIVFVLFVRAGAGAGATRNLFAPDQSQLVQEDKRGYSPKILPITSNEKKFFHTAKPHKMTDTDTDYVQIDPEHLLAPLLQAWKDADAAIVAECERETKQATSAKDEKLTALRDALVTQERQLDKELAEHVATATSTRDASFRSCKNSEGRR